jgi:hypothetical protein
MGIEEESALIVYDPASKTEHFIRRAQFRTDAAYFGFLVPTPSLPHLAEVNDQLFRQLEALTAPAIRTETKYRDRSLFAGFEIAEAKVRVGSMNPRAAVEVIDQQKIAGMDATILRATDAEKLREWLAQHGYEARPALTAWLKWYVDNGWYLTAFQYKKENTASEGLNTRAVRISFETDRPFYPYREPADAREGDDPKGRRLKVFYASTARASGTLGESGTWPGKTVWANALTPAQAETLTQALADPRPQAEHSAPAASLPATVWLTEFLDESSPRPGTDEVYFQQSQEQQSLKRPDQVQYDYVDRISRQELFLLSVLGGLVLLAVGLIGWRRMASPPRPEGMA